MKAHLQRKSSIVRTVISGALIVATGASAGFWVAEIVPDGTLISFFKFATILLGVVWAFSMLVYNKLSDLTDLPGIDYKQHRGLESAIQLRLQWFWFRAGALGIAGLVANLPMFLKDGGITPMPWTFAIAAAALVLAMFLLRRVWAELEDIRELRSEVKELERRERERAEQIQSLRESVAEWESNPKLGSFGKKTEVKKDLDSSQ